ncbi:hypothetical protein C7B61_12995 [filamentous cyanobacterium CCP1]|nr:hypothetical protein C7B76_13220 [filamentous cyanobacterium CCP2]PSB63739.1 hypothetical protein C7B61_12995 [filamentous cyanobacterium CCP1]
MAVNKDNSPMNRKAPATNDLLDDRSLQETIAEPEPGSDLEVDGLPIDEDLDVPPSQPGAKSASDRTNPKVNDEN